MELRKSLYRYDEVATLLSVSLRHVFWLVQQGELTRVYTGKGRHSARITAESIHAFLKRIGEKNGSLVHPP